MEEIKWAKDKNQEITEKYKNETAYVDKQKEQLSNLHHLRRTLESEFKQKQYLMVFIYIYNVNNMSTGSS